MKHRFKYDPNKTAAEKEELTGPVWKVMQTVYKAHLKAGTVIQGKIESENIYDSANFIKTFNEKGARMEDELFAAGGRHHKIYNDKAQEIEQVHYDKNGAIVQKTMITYDQWGHLILYVTSNGAGENMHRTVNNFNEQGKQLDNFQYYGKEERLIRKSIYSYDDKGNHLSTIETDEKGNKSGELLNTYDDKGRRIENISRQSIGTKHAFYQHNTYKYNEHNDVTEMTYYNEDGSLKDTHVYSYEYDSEGKRIIPSRPPLEEEKPEGETEQCEYDTRGNWTRKTIFHNNIPTNIVTRELIYHGEPDRSLVHPLLNAPAEEVKNVIEPMEEMEPEDAKWLVDVPNMGADGFSCLRYYAINFKEHPSLVVYSGPYIEALVLLKKLKEDYHAQEIHSYSTVWRGHGEQVVRYTLAFPHYHGYLLQATGISPQDEDDFSIPDFFNVERYGSFYTSSFNLYRPSDASGNRDESFEEWLGEAIYSCSLNKKPEKPVINIIEVKGGNFAVKEYAVENNFEIKDLDVNYGPGFSTFHDDLMRRFHKSTKGLVLFHGQPGTGKTYYIRHLLRKMIARKKVVIYMPPNMVDHLVEPAFMTFLADEVRDYSADGNFCVLLIEDAEPLLTKRVEGVRIQGVTNLLNMSDGLLNDMLNLQIICTFNVDLRKLDSALLRPGRLIARKEFKPLSELDANLLAHRLGIKHHFTAPATLGEIYAMRKDNNTLIHDVDTDKNSSTFIDDLL